MNQIERKSSVMETLLKKVSLEDVESFFTDPAFVDELVNSIFHGARALEVDDVLVIVDYSDPLEYMLRHRWERVYANINEEYFSIPKRLIGRRSIIRTKLFHFNEAVTSEQVEKKMTEDGYRPATLPELLAFGMKGRGELLSNYFPIVALTTSKLLDGEDEPHVPFLGVAEVNETTVESARYSRKWHYNFRFLGVRI